MAMIATGRKAASLGHESFLRHARFRWLKIALLLSLAAVVAFFFSYAPDFRLRHGGGTWFGYASGTLGAGLMIWLTLLGLRKRAMNDGRWQLKAWVSAHIYLGLSLLVIVSLHSGFQFGWNVHTLAYGLMLLVILSGIVGVVFYVRLPPRLSEERGETTRQQMLEAIAALDRRLEQAAQPLGQYGAAAVRLSLEREGLDSGLLQRAANIYPSCGTRQALAQVRRLRGQDEGAAALGMVEGLLEQKLAILARARRYAQLKALLEVWLRVHVPATFAMLAAVTAHVVSVFFYW